MIHLKTVWVAFACIVAVTNSSACAVEIQIKVHAGGHDRANCPVSMALPKACQDLKRLELTRNDNGQSIAIQRAGGPKSPRLIWMIHERISAGKTRGYTLTATEGRARRNPLVRCVDDGAKLTLSVGNTPVLKFNHATVEAPEGIQPVYRRSGYIHPVFTPSGNVVTGDFEKDHPHQHGIFNALVNASFRGGPADFWNQAKGNGDVEFTELRNRRNGPVFAQFSAQLTHVAVHEDQRVPAIHETWQVRVYNTQKPFLFEITSRQKLASESPVIANEYHYGGFAFRGPSEWLQVRDDTDEKQDPVAAAGFLTSSGRTRADGNHTRARWVEMHGPIGSQHAGMIVLAAQNNFRSPQTVRLHPNKPYFCFAPMVLGEFATQPQQVYSSRFRFVVHDGDADPKLAERMWQDFAHPPVVNVKSDE